MKRIEIDTGSLYRCITEFEDNLSLLIGEVDKTYSDVKALDSTWQGQAKAAFDRQFELDYARMVEICNELSAYARRLVSARQEYDRGEAQVGEIIASIEI